MESNPESDRERQIAWLNLKLIQGLGNRSILRLVKHFGTPEAVLQANAKELASVTGLREHAVSALQKRETLRPPREEWEAIKSKGIRTLCLDDADYPSNLAEIPDPPALLFIEGSVEPRDLVSIAVVGSRAASPMGMSFTERLCQDLAQSGITIVSGLAVGIDSAAHKGAVKAGGRTLAVLGCGLDIDYPRTNSELRKRIAQCGALYSEFPLGTPPAAANFPMRNRIISGLSLGVVVVEAAHQSGSLITARLALEQGREVFAVPGLARHFRSTGPHRLLRQGAKLVESAEDILEEIRPLIRPTSASQPKAAPALPGPEVNEEEKTLLVHIDENPQHIDEICRSVQWPISRVTAVLLALELKGIVRQLPGKYFVLAH